MASKKKPPHRGAQPPNPFAALTSYYEGLPNGWASYPECLVKGWFSNYLRERAALDAIQSIPERLDPALLSSHLTNPLEWIPEVAHVALLLAVRDTCFAPTPRGEEDCLEWMTQLNRSLFSQPEVAAALNAPLADGVARVPQIWAMFHRGTPMTLMRQDSNSAAVLLEHPAGLFPPISVETQRRAFALAAAKSGAVNPDVRVKTDRVPGARLMRTVVEATWL